MSKIANDGGPAFPGIAGESGCGNQTRQTNSNGDEVWVNHNQGMTMRDHFAALAMQGECAAQSEDYNIGDAAIALVAEKAYKLADAMLLEREKGKV